MPTPPGEPEVELGTGSWRFEALADDDEVALVRGSQGGWHVWLSVRAYGVDTRDVTLTIETQPEDESRPPDRVEVDVRVSDVDDEGMRSLLGWPAIVPSPECLVGQRMRLSVTLRTSEGMELTDERILQIAPGADPPPPCG